VNLSFLVLIIACVLAAFGAWPYWGAPPAPAWRGYFWPASWFLFLLSLCLAHGGINVHG
jgi:hypothetical protein